MSFMKGLTSFIKSFLQSPHNNDPPLQLLYLWIDSSSLSKRYFKYQYTGHISAFPPNFLCNETVGCPPVNVFFTFFSINSGSSLVNNAESGLEDDIFPLFISPGINLLCICAGL